MIPQDKNVRQLAWHLWYVEGSEIYCDNTEDDRNSVASQASCRMDVTRLEQCAYIKIAMMRGRNARECHSVLYCYNKEDDRNSVVSQVSCRVDVTRLEQRIYIKIAGLQGRNARECHSELVEAVVNSSIVHLLLDTMHWSINAR
jgi:hypothetical protein